MTTSRLLHIAEMTIAVIVIGAATWQAGLSLIIGVVYRGERRRTSRRR